jgi:hypothetical protein
MELIKLDYNNNFILINKGKYSIAGNEINVDKKRKQLSKLHFGLRVLPVKCHFY